MDENLVNEILNQIKSLYIIKKVMLFLHQNKKLGLIKYSNYWLNKFNLNIEDIKKASQKYRIIDENNFLKEYLLDTNILIFKGEYLNKKRNGKGKEYHYNGRLKFDGDFINGKKMNGREYDNKGNLILTLRRIL